MEASSIVGWPPVRLCEVPRGNPAGSRYLSGAGCGARAGQPLPLSLGGEKNENELFPSVPHVPFVTVLNALAASPHAIFPSPMREVLQWPFYN